MMDFFFKTVCLSSCCIGYAASRSAKEHQTQPPPFGLNILATQAILSNPNRALDLHRNSLQYAIFSFLMEALLAEMIGPQMCDVRPLWQA
jgi:hypothetical protein